MDKPLLASLLFEPERGILREDAGGVAFAVVVGGEMVLGIGITGDTDPGGRDTAPLATGASADGLNASDGSTDRDGGGMSTGWDGESEFVLLQRKSAGTGEGCTRKSSEFNDVEGPESTSIGPRPVKDMSGGFSGSSDCLEGRRRSKRCAAGWPRGDIAFIVGLETPLLVITTPAECSGISVLFG
jgi:hypothetical protein